MKNKISLISLRKLLIKMIIVYWIAPFLLIIFVLSGYSNLQIRNGFLDEITVSANGALGLSQSNLSYLVQESKKATYDEVLKNVYTEYQENNDLVELYRGTSTYLKNAYKYNAYINEAVLIYHNVENKIYYSNNTNSTSHFANIETFMNVNYDKFMQVSDEINTSVRFVEIDGQLFLCRNLVNSKFTPYAFLIFKLNVEEVFDNIINLPFAKESSVVIDGNYLQISGTDNILNNYEFSNKSRVFQTPQKDYVYQNAFERKDFTTYYNVLIKTDILNQDYRILLILIMVVVLFIIPMISLAVHIFYKHFSVPVRSMIESSRKIEKGRIGYQIQREPESEEFEYLFNRFNSMSTSLKEQVEVIYKEQEALHNAKIKALQSQINPHFLNNTLEVINWEMRLGETDNAIKMIESLSTMLNASTSRNEQRLRHLKEELIYVDAYLFIVKTRMGKRLEVIKQIDESVTAYQVPLLILQPVVENAIEHGIGNRKFGVVIIRAYEDNNNLIIEVENDNELSDKDRDRIEKLLSWDENTNEKSDEEHIAHTSLGIRNVNARIKLIFGENYRLTITSTEKNGTLARIIVPKR